ncbi:MAG: caspase family protein [Eubacteriales bacterium]
MLKLPKVIAIVSLILSLQVSLVSADSGAGQANRYKPVKAQDVEIVKKAALKGAPAKPDKTLARAATGTIGAAIPAGGKKYAIVIGISDYPGTSSDLSFGDKDAIEVKNVLITDYGFNAVKILTNNQATTSAIYDEVKNMKALLGPDDELVFFYSGHGAKGKADDGDSNKTDQSIVVWKGSEAQGFDFIWDGQLKDWFSGFSNSRIIFIFDSCLSGGMSVLNSPGRIVNMACTANGLSYEGDSWGGGHGQFTYYFVMQGLDAGKADSFTKDGIVTVEEAFDYSKVNCISQTPTIADGFQNDLNLD